MRVRVVVPHWHAGRGWAVGEEYEVDGENLVLLMRGGRIEPSNREGWRRQERPPNVSWQANPEAEVARGPAADPHNGRTW